MHLLCIALRRCRLRLQPGEPKASNQVHPARRTKAKSPSRGRAFCFQYGGEGGIRTPDTLPYTHFPGVLLQPLGHLTTLFVKWHRTAICLSTGRYIRGKALEGQPLFQANKRVRRGFEQTPKRHLAVAFSQALPLTLSLRSAAKSSIRLRGTMALSAKAGSTWISWGCSCSALSDS